MKGIEFAKESFSDSLSKPPIQLPGKAKKGQTEGLVLYQPWNSQGNGVQIPAEMIEKADNLGSASCCADCSHVSMRITLKRATTDEGKVLQKLFSRSDMTFLRLPHVLAYHPDLLAGLCPVYYASMRLMIS